MLAVILPSENLVSPLISTVNYISACLVMKNYTQWVYYLLSSVVFFLGALGSGPALSQNT